MSCRNRQVAIPAGRCSNNFGTATNDSTHLGDVNNTGAGAVVTYSATGGTWTANLSNSGGAINSGKWNGDANNASMAINSGIWNAVAAGYTNSGTLTTTGTLKCNRPAA
jgi:hypothetical protein